MHCLEIDCITDPLFTLFDLSTAFIFKASFNEYFYALYCIEHISILQNV
jgi:hypothetical protein